MERVTLARQAMATRFEFVLAGLDPVRSRAAGEEALEEIERIEARLSLYRASSDVAQVNARAADQPVRVSPEVFELLGACRALSAATEGLFDITVAPLVRCWGFMKGSGSRPTDEEIERARGLVGMHLLELDAERNTVRFARAGMMLDLGSIGKGFALDAAAEILRENGVVSALMHGGTSTVYGIGRDPETGGPWKVAVELPSEAGGGAEVLSVVELEDRALSVSAVWGKHFRIDGQVYGHVIDPSTGWPTRHGLLGAVVVDSAAVSDALSTGVLLGDEALLGRMRERVPGMGLLQARRDGRLFAGLEEAKRA
jgi:FAD:protein FMN transferase